MGSPQATDRLSDEQIALEATVMALREEIMSFFKGSCITRVAQTEAIRTVELSEYQSRPRYAYQRQRLATQKPTMLFLGDAPILTVSKQPDTIVFHTTVLGRSPQFRAVHAELEEFVERYLRGIKKEVNSGPVFYT